MKHDLDALASVGMERGIALLDSDDPDAIHDAIRCFEEAIDLRGRLPLAGNPGFRYGLAGGWINRGDALTRLGGGEHLVEAIKSYSMAIELLKELPASDDGLFARRLAIAWMNRGLALEGVKGEASLAEATESYRKAVEALTHSDHIAAAGHKLVLASAWVNLGNALMRSTGSEAAEEACAVAGSALSLVAETESKELAAAEAALKARHILCQALTVLLSAPSDDESKGTVFVGRITDTAEDALRLAQSWERAGEIRFRPLATQFFHLTTLVYEKHQPHFLAEFLREHLDPDRVTCLLPVNESWLAIGRESLSRVRCGLGRRGFAWLATPEGIRHLKTLKELHTTEARLQVLHAAAR